MQKKILVFLILISNQLVFSQSNLTIFNNGDLAFHVILNGIKQNLIPQKNVTISNLSQGGHALKISFANGASADIDKKIFLDEPSDIRMSIEFKKGIGKLRIISYEKTQGTAINSLVFRPNDNAPYSDNNTPLNNPSNSAVNNSNLQTNSNSASNTFQNSTTAQNGSITSSNTSNTSTTTSQNNTNNSGNSSNENITFNIGTNGMNMTVTDPITGQNLNVNFNANVNTGSEMNNTISGNNTQTSSVTYTTSTSLSTTNNVNTGNTTTNPSNSSNSQSNNISHPLNNTNSNQNSSFLNGNAKINCSKNLGNIENYLTDLNKISFESDKIELIKKDFINTCLTSNQAFKIVKTLTFESNKLEISKFLSDRMINRNNASELLQLFTFESSKEEYNLYIHQ